MKSLLCLIISGILCNACIQSENGNTAAQTQRMSAPTKTFAELLMLNDAEKILGEPALLSDSSTRQEAKIMRYQCAYKAKAEDTKTSKTGVIYFLIEQYENDSLAHHKYAFIKKANEDHGIKTLDDVGDEAYFHSDKQNFYFVMVRKGMKVFNMKVNKITSKTSLDEFNKISRQIATMM